MLSNAVNGGMQSSEEDADLVVPGEPGSRVSFRQRPSIVVDTFKAPMKSTGGEDSVPLNRPSAHHLDLYEEDIVQPTHKPLETYLRQFTSPPLAEEKEANDRPRRKANLGVVLGVYLPTIQHIFGVIMFLRLYWIVGMAGALEAAFLVFLCCVCTFLTCISMSAIATNGVVESGGSYFMISRNLGPEFGSAIGILFYLANTVATSMYLVGGVEMLLTYLAPGLPRVGEIGHHGEPTADLYNNFRIYATGILLVEFLIVAVGVRFVQIFAPISLSCVIVSILAVYVGGFAASPDKGPQVCLLGDRLLSQSSSSVNYSCDKSMLEDTFCKMSANGTMLCDAYYLANNVTSVAGFPGPSSGVFLQNLFNTYTKKGEITAGVSSSNPAFVSQDMTTSFFVLLAIYFPSVTGIMTGSNMSGDLADPQKSIPIGTIAAQLTTSFVYLTFIFLFAGTIHPAVLRDKFGASMAHKMVTAQLSWPSPWVLLIGSFTSTFGAALQCLCSAPRLLQSIAKDEVLPFLNIFSRLTRFGEPFYALLLTTLIAECGILIGNVDLIAPVVDFFFLMCYCFVNVICAMQTLLSAPNWRPRFRFYHWTLSLLGAFLCLFIMFATYWYYALVVIALCAGIYKYVEFTGAKKEWGDGIRGLGLSTARYSLLRIEEEDQHTKNWRPQVLVMLKTGEEELEPKSRQVLGFSTQLKTGKGLLMVASLIEGDLTDAETRSAAKKAREIMREALRHEKARGFAQAVICSNRKDGFSVLIQSLGLGALRPNTVVVGWPSNWNTASGDSQYYDFLDAIQRVTDAGISLLIPKGTTFPCTHSEKLTGCIDVWWILHDGGLLLLLPFLLKGNRVWRNCSIRVFAVASPTDNSLKMRQDLNKWIYQLRIEATVEIVELGDSDLTAYANQKTLAMEKRVQMLQKLNLKQKDLKAQPQQIVDTIRRTSESKLKEKSPELELEERHNPINSTYTFSASRAQQLLAGQQEVIIEVPDMERLSSPPDSEDNLSDLASEEDEADKVYRAKVKKMHNALKLNQKILEMSGGSQLVIINLPRPPRSREALNNYIHYLDALSDGLDRVLFVRGTGKEVITIYS